MKWRFVSVMLITLLGFAPSAHAFITLDAIVPSSPVAGETVAARVSAGVCDTIIESPGYPQITQSGNAIRMLLETAHSDDPVFCNFGTGTIDLSFGEFPAGAYTLQLDRHYVDFIGVSVTQTVGSASFIVAGGDAVTPLPTLGAASAVVLGTGMLALAGFMLRRRARTIVYAATRGTRQR